MILSVFVKNSSLASDEKADDASPRPSFYYAWRAHKKQTQTLSARPTARLFPSLPSLPRDPLSTPAASMRARARVQAYAATAAERKISEIYPLSMDPKNSRSSARIAPAHELVPSRTTSGGTSSPATVPSAPRKHATALCRPTVATRSSSSSSCS